MPKFNPDRLRIARELTCHTQSSLAGSVGVTRNAIALYESGKSVPSANVLASLTRILDQPYDYFFVEQATHQTPKSNMELA